MLRRCLESVAAQTIGSLECIVVDDASRTAADVMPKDPRFRLVDLPENVGETRARQAGVEMARGEVVCFLDDDDLWTPDRLEIAEQGLLRAPVALCWTRWADEKEGSPGRLLEGDVGRTILDSITPHLGATAVMREVLVPFDSTYRANGDTEWWIRQAAAAPVFTVPEVGLLNGRHEGERHGNDDNARLAASFQLLESHPDYFRSNRGARSFRWYRIAVLSTGRSSRLEVLGALLRSIVARPSLRAGRHLTRTLWPKERKRPRRVRTNR